MVKSSRKGGRPPFFYTVVPSSRREVLISLFYSVEPSRKGKDGAFFSYDRVGEERTFSVFYSVERSRKGRRPPFFYMVVLSRRREVLLSFLLSGTE